MTANTSKRLLIANRGEIVCRIARTARRLGWTVIAVYSDADRGAKHVREADEAYHLGPSPASQSYLDRKRIIELARRVRAHGCIRDTAFCPRTPTSPKGASTPA